MIVTRSYKHIKIKFKTTSQNLEQPNTVLVTIHDSKSKKEFNHYWYRSLYPKSKDIRSWLSSWDYIVDRLCHYVTQYHTRTFNPDAFLTLVPKRPSNDNT